MFGLPTTLNQLRLKLQQWNSFLSRIAQLTGLNYVRVRRSRALLNSLLLRHSENQSRFSSGTSPGYLEIASVLTMVSL